MPISPDHYSLRVRYTGTDPVHAARKHPVKGHRTVCLLWLDPEHAHTWYAEDVEVTCANCLKRMGPAILKYAAMTPGTVGTLQRRLAEVVENEMPPGWGNLTGQRIAEAVENWRREIEEQIRLKMNAMLLDETADTTRSNVVRSLVKEVSQSIGVIPDTLTDEAAE